MKNINCITCDGITLGPEAGVDPSDATAGDASSVPVDFPRVLIGILAPSTNELGGL